MRFSIIIPVYNVEKYIGRCMETVMGQSFRDYEVIVVDDETPDNSMKIVEEYAERYPGQIHMIHQKNTRQGGARNRGVREAKGEYILFVDSDDYVSTDMLKIADEKLRQNPCDILVFQHMSVTEDEKPLTTGSFGSLTPGVYNPKETTELVKLSCEPWRKAFLRTFYVNSGVEFPEKILYEDTVTRVLMAKADKVVLCNDILYYYVQSSNSSIRRKPSERMLDILTVCDMVIGLFQRDQLYDSFREPLQSALIGGIVYILDVINDADVNSPLQNNLIDYIMEKFPNCMENPYIDDELRWYLKTLLARNYRKYHTMVILPRRFKNWLLTRTVAGKLNQMRKRL